MSVFKIECLKLYKRKSIKVLLIIFGIVLIALSAMYLFSEAKIGVSLYNEGQFLTASLSVLMAFVLPFTALFVSSTAFGIEFGKGTIKNMFLLPIEKYKLFVNKVLAVQSLMALLLSVLFVYSLIFAVAIDGGFTFAVLGSALSHYIGAFLILGLINLIGAMMSLLVSSTGLSVFISYIAYMALGIVGLYFPIFKSVSITTLISNYKFIFSGDVPTSLLSVIAYYIILLTVGTVIFEKKEESVCQYE